MSDEVVLEFHHHRHHEIRVKAYELHEALVKAHGVDYGPEFYWYTAEWQLGLIPDEPIAPPVE